MCLSKSKLEIKHTCWQENVSIAVVLDIVCRGGGCSHLQADTGSNASAPTFSFSRSVVLPALSRPRMSRRSSSLRTKYSHRPYSRENMWPLPALPVVVGVHGGGHCKKCIPAVKQSPLCRSPT